MARSVLIKDGVLQQYMTDVLSARQIKAAPHGQRAARASATCPSRA